MEMTFQFMGSIRKGIMQSLLSQNTILKASGLLLSVKKHTLLEVQLWHLSYFTGEKEWKTDQHRHFFS